MLFVRNSTPAKCFPILSLVYACYAPFLDALWYRSQDQIKIWDHMIRSSLRTFFACFFQANELILKSDSSSHRLPN